MYLFSVIRVANSAKNESTPVLLPPSAPSKKRSPTGTSVSVDNASTLNLSNIEKDTEGNKSRLERQDAVDGSPTKDNEEVVNMSNLSIVDALDRNTSQLHAMFSDLSRQVEDRIDQIVNEKLEQATEKKDDPMN